MYICIFIYIPQRNINTVYKSSLFVYNILHRYISYLATYLGHLGGVMLAPRWFCVQLRAHVRKQGNLVQTVQQIIQAEKVC